MVMYVCKKCKRSFDQKSDFTRHINRKTDCTKIKYEKKKEEKDNTCYECKKNFSRACSLKRHINTCKGGKVIIKVQRDKNIYNECTINNTINIKELKLVVFGKEGIEHLSSDDLLEILKSKTGLIESLIQNTNFNPDKPQFHNIYYPDVKSGFGDIYGEKGWKTKNINEILNRIIDAKTEDISEILKKFGDVINNKIKERLQDAVRSDSYKNIESRKLMKKYLKAILFNGSKTINKPTNNKQKN